MSSTSTTFEEMKGEFERIEAELMQAQANFEAAKFARDAVAKKHKQMKEELMEWQLNQPSRWNDNYRKLVKWKEENDGDTIVAYTKDSPEHVKKLNNWVIMNRQYYRYYKNGSNTKAIKDYQIYALNKIDFVWDVHDHLWNQNMELLIDYHKEFGNFEVPKEHQKLKGFIQKVRTAFRKKNNGQVQQELNEERIAQLNELNFDWGGKNLKPRKSGKPVGYAVQYEPMVKILAEFKEEHGHLRIHSVAKNWKQGTAEPTKAEYRALPKFISFMRNEHDLWREGKQSSLDEEKVQHLTELGIQWKKPVSEYRRLYGPYKRKRELNEEYMKEKIQPQGGNASVPDASNFPAPGSIPV